GLGRLPISLDGSLEEHGRLLLVAKVGIGAAARPVAVAHGLHRHVAAVSGILFAAQALRPGWRTGAFGRSGGCGARTARSAHGKAAAAGGAVAERRRDARTHCPCALCSRTACRAGDAAKTCRDGGISGGCLPEPVGGGCG